MFPPQTIQFSMSTQFNCRKRFYFEQFIQTILIQLILFKYKNSSTYNYSV